MRTLVAVGCSLLLAWPHSAPPHSATSHQSAPPIDSGVFAELRWRHIGPARGGPTTAAVGIPTDPLVFYIGTDGSGVWKTTDGGRTWTALFDGQPTGSIGAIAIAPSNANVVYAGTDAGVFRSADAGRTWTHQGLRDAQEIATILVDPADPNRVLVAAPGHPYGPHPERGVFRSADGGRTFERVLGQDGDTGATHLELDPADSRTVFAVLSRLRRSPWEDEVFVESGVDTGVFRSSDGGTTWQPSATGLPTSAGDRLRRPAIAGSDSWSSPSGQANGAFAQVTADNAFPYRVCGGRPAAGPVCVSSRSDPGRPATAEVIAADPGGSVAPDPADPDVVYGGQVSRFDRRTGQTQDLSPPRGSTFRAGPMAPVQFSPVESRALFFGANTLWKTINGGLAWTEISPDLSREVWETPPTVGVFRSTPAAAPSRRGVIAAVAPSYLDPNVIWAGTDDGLIHVTRDAGRSWTDVTPAGLPAWSRVSRIEASHFDVNFAYAVVNAVRLDDRRPHIYRTKDGGRTWAHVVAGLPPIGAINVVREDPFRRGMLFAGSDGAVSVSFDDGERWQSLQLNLPATPVRDLVVKDEDLVVATHGRGFWILDDITPLRQITPDVLLAPAFLFRPGTGWRFRGQDGVAFSYVLGSDVTGPVTLEIFEGATADVLRRYSSDDPAGHQPRLAATPGLHRFIWDMRYPPPVAGVRGMWVVPGAYTMRLTVGGRTYRQAVLVRLDPRVKTSAADLAAQLRLSKTLDVALRQVSTAIAAATRDGRTPAPAALTQAASTLAALFERIQQADVRPTAAQEAAVAAAIARAEAALR